jgi:hypothetical protein
VIEFRRQAWEVANAVTVAVGELFDVELIEDRVLIPERIS